MINHPLFVRLSRMPIGDQNEFYFYAPDAKCKKGAEVERLVQVLRKSAAWIAGDKTREDLFNEIYKKEAYHERRLLNLLQDANLCLERFLVKQQLEKEPMTQESLLARAYKRFGMEEDYRESLQKQMAIQEAEEPKGMLYWYERTRILRDAYLNPFLIKDEKAPAKERLMEMVESLENYFVSARLFWGCELENYQKVYSLQMDSSNNSLLDEWLKEYPAFSGSMAALRDLYFRLKAGNEDDFSELQQNVLASLPREDQDTQRAMLYFLIHVAARKMSRFNDLPSRQNLFQLYRLGLDMNILAGRFDITHNLFVSIVQLGCTLGELEYVKGFASEYEPQLIDNEFKAETIALCQAQIAFSGREFKQAMTLLRQVQMRRQNIRLKKDNMLIMCMIEITDENYAAADACDALRKSISRDKSMSPLFLELQINFIELCKMLVNAKYFKKERDRFRKELASRQNVANRTWLLQKEKELPL